MWAFHGLKDDLVDPNDTRRIADWIRDLKRSAGLDTMNVRATFHPEADHNSSDSAFAKEELPRWIGEQVEER